MTYKQDLELVLAYAKQQGITITYNYNKNPKASADCEYWNGKITVSKAYITSTKSLIVTLLHEISHIMAYRSDNSSMDHYVSSAYRTYLIEKRDISKMLTIGNTIGLQRMPKEYIRAWQDFDTWNYWYEWMYKKEPSAKERREVRKTISIRHGLRYTIR